MIPLSMPYFEGNELKYVSDAVQRVWVSTAGDYVKQLEKMLAEYLCTGSVAVCQSGTSAIHMSLIEAGVSGGDIVLVPALTFIAAVNPVKYLNAEPIFMDCDDSLCIDRKKLRRFCEEECEFIDGVLSYRGTPVKAIIVVHVFGNMADMEAIMEISNRFSLKVIEDATEALGTRYTSGIYNGRFAGTIGDFGCYSFNGNKIITTGGGGAVTSKITKSVDHMRFLSTQAKTDPLFYQHDEVGFNYRMTNVQAAIGVAQMEKLSEYIRRKQKNYQLYVQEFEGFENASLMTFRSGTSSNQWLYSLNIRIEHMKITTKELVGRLRESGIETRMIWGLINEQKPYAESVEYNLDKAPFYASRILNIPSSTNITEAEISFVSGKIKELLR